MIKVFISNLVLLPPSPCVLSSRSRGGDVTVLEKFTELGLGRTVEASLQRPCSIATPGRYLSVLYNPSPWFGHI